ncbi:hypothetical protein HDU67_002343 [Dinochytrium kinnereticum]|nr:hypothetical protein HDU67_002343 [Dinochytrium kinnereticum]
MLAGNGRPEVRVWIRYLSTDDLFTVTVPRGSTARTIKIKCLARLFSPSSTLSESSFGLMKGDLRLNSDEPVALHYVTQVSPLVLIDESPTPSITFTGPINPSLHFEIKLGELPWGKEVLGAIDAGDSVVLSGYQQSGRTSALLSIQRAFHDRGVKAHYVDLSELWDDDSVSLFRYLASWMRLTGDVAGITTSFDFYELVFNANKEPPLLLMDEGAIVLGENGEQSAKRLRELELLLGANRRCQAQGRGFAAIVFAGSWWLAENLAEGFRGETDGEDPIHSEISQRWSHAIHFIQVEGFPKETFQDFVGMILKALTLSRPLSSKTLSNKALSGIIAEDIWELTGGHPGFSMQLLKGAMDYATGLEDKDKFPAEWLGVKRTLVERLHASLSVRRLVNRLLSFKGPSVHSPNNTSPLQLLTTDYTASARLIPASLIVNGIAEPLPADAYRVRLTSPLLRDVIMKDSILFKTPKAPLAFMEKDSALSGSPFAMLTDISLKTTSGYILDLLIHPDDETTSLFSVPRIHLEFFRCASSIFSADRYRVHPESTVCDSGAAAAAGTLDTCSLWMREAAMQAPHHMISFLSEQTYLDNIQKANTILSKHFQSTALREMVFVVFLSRREAAAFISFPLKVDLQIPAIGEGGPSVHLLFVTSSRDGDRNAVWRIAVGFGFRDWHSGGWVRLSRGAR